MKVIYTMGWYENLGWCAPYISKDEKYAFAIKEGEIACAMVGGEDVDITLENIHKLAKAINGEYDLYGAGWTDTAILIDAVKEDFEEVGCRDCPWAYCCDAVNEPLDGEEGEEEGE